MANQEVEKVCYICGRSEKEFSSIFNPTIYDTQISEFQSNISKELKIISDDIQDILEKTKSYDLTSTIDEMDKNDKIYSKFMPYWRLLLKYLNYRYSEYATSELASTVRNRLEKAVEAINDGKIPDGIKLNDEIQSCQNKLQALKLKKDMLDSLTSFPEFRAHKMTVINKDKEEIVFKFKLCPVCSKLHQSYHASIQDDDDWTWYE